jgi:enoyl-[acyl-carrier-protein] reductase (NADH)
MGFLAGKRFLITGVISNRSIAYGIARACHREGAELAFSYQGERFKERVGEFAAEFGSSLVFDCDVADDAQIDALFAQLGAAFSKACRASRSESPTTSPATASRHSPRRLHPGCARDRRC